MISDRKRRDASPEHGQAARATPKAIRLT